MLSAHLYRVAGGIVAAAVATLIPLGLIHSGPGTPSAGGHTPAATVSPAPTVTVTRTTGPISRHTGSRLPGSHGRAPSLVDLLSPHPHAQTSPHPGTSGHTSGTRPSGGHPGPPHSTAPAPPPRSSPPHTGHPSPSPTKTTPPACLTLHPVLAVCLPPLTLTIGG